MKHLLMARGMWGLVDGSEVLADDATAAAQAFIRSKLLKRSITLPLLMITLGAELYTL